MHFTTFPVEEAEGIVLAHSLRAGGVAMKKGRRLSAADVQILKAEGRVTVMGARLSADDVDEDAAAAAVAQAVAGSGVRVAAPFTGRANLFAVSAGVALFDSAAIGRLNLIDESITLATVRNGERVDAGQMIATVKIIPFAVPRDVVSRAVALASASQFEIATFKPHRVGLILTQLPATKASVLEKRERVIRDRLTSMGSSIGETVIVAHDTAAVAGALRALRVKEFSPLMVFAASAIVDRHDVIGAGIIAAGGRLERLGMPVDPGNLLLIGDLAGTTAIGIPSCAASPALNGFDWVLERVLAGRTPDSETIALMGVGGLLKEIASRPQPRVGGRADMQTGGMDAGGARHAARVACAILAGGRSSRMGSNKLLEPVGGKPIVRHVVEAALASVARPVLVVTGHQADGVRGALAGLDVQFVHNPDFANGISATVKAAIGALTSDVDGVLIALGDMPELRTQQIDRLVAAFSPKDGRSIVVPVSGGRRGNPVLWGAAYFDEMGRLSGDTGAKHLLAAHNEEIAEVDVDSDAVLIDIDTPEALAALRQRSIAGAADA